MSRPPPLRAQVMGILLLGGLLIAVLVMNRRCGEGVGAMFRVLDAPSAAPAPAAAPADGRAATTR